MPPKLPRGAYLLIGFLMNLMLGTVYSWSVFKGVLTAAPYNASDFMANVPFAVALAMFAVGMVFAGRLVDKHGPAKVAILGGLLVGAGYMLSSLMDKTPWPLVTLTITYGVIGGLGLGFAYNPPIPTAVRWFPARKGLASGIVVMGFGLSPLATAPIATALIGSYGLPNTALILGAVFLVVLVGLGALLAFPPADWQPPAEIITKASKRTWKPFGEVETREMIRTPTFWGAWIIYALGTAGGFMIIGNAKQIAQIEGHVADAVLLTAAVQILAVFNSGGRPLFGRIADVFTPKRALLLMYLVLMGAMGLLAVSTSWIPVYLGIGLAGMVFGGFLAVMPALSTLFFGAKNSGANYGMLFTGYGIGAIVALFAGSLIKDAYGSYVPAFYIGILLSLAGLVLTLLVRPPRPIAARVAPERAPARA
ncbi:MAG: OFA family MFS transporter [Thermoplasmata archaeon]